MVSSEIIFEVKDSPEGGFEAQALGFSIFTEGDDYEELNSNIREAVKCHFESGKPKIIRVHYIKEETFAA